jgi:nickel-dependent lactate racemase
VCKISGISASGVIESISTNKVFPVETFQKNINTYIQNNNLNFKRTAIVLADKTRICNYNKYIPALADVLMRNGCLEKNINFYIAYGTHKKQRESISEKIYGDVYNKYLWKHHDCSDISIFIEVGVTSNGTKVRIRKDICNATCVITFGAVSHHYFAGFGGGRKLLFPGLAYKDDIYKNHSLVYDNVQDMFQTGCQSGHILGNPVAMDLEEISSFKKADIAINAVLSCEGETQDIILGDPDKSFKKACNIYNAFYAISGKRQYENILASCGGYPKDLNMIQIHKSIHNACGFIKPGGTLILFAEAEDGLGSNSFYKFFLMEDHEFKSILKSNYSGNAGTVLSIKRLTKQFKVYMVTSLSSDICSAMNIHKIQFTKAKEILKKMPDFAFIPNASMCYAG